MWQLEGYAKNAMADVLSAIHMSGPQPLLGSVTNATTDPTRADVSFVEDLELAMLITAKSVHF